MTYLEKAMQVYKISSRRAAEEVIDKECPDMIFDTEIVPSAYCRNNGCKECWNRLYDDEEVL